MHPLCVSCAVLCVCVVRVCVCVCVRVCVCVCVRVFKTLARIVLNEACCERWPLN